MCATPTCADCTEWPLVQVARHDGATTRVCLRTAKIISAEQTACGRFEAWVEVIGPASANVGKEPR